MHFVDALTKPNNCVFVDLLKPKKIYAPSISRRTRLLLLLTRYIIHRIAIRFIYECDECASPWIGLQTEITSKLVNEFLRE